MNEMSGKTAKLQDGTTVNDYTMLYKGKLYVPGVLRADVIESCHDTPVAGHPGQWRTLEIGQRSYWWLKCLF